MKFLRLFSAFCYNMSHMRVLVVEDEYKIANSVKKGLVQEGMVVDIAYDGVEGYDLAHEEEFDVIVLDIMLPGMDGIKICKELRRAKIHTPILMLTAKGEVSDRVGGLNAGADDYLAKPFSFSELLARVRALARRPKEVVSTKLAVGDLSLDPIKFEVKRAKRKIDLSKKEFTLLEYLMQNPNTILTKDKIISHVWDYDAEILPNTVEVFIGYLRQKIDKAYPKEKPLIKTIRGFGYKISDN